jgi:hypothetical protein
MSKHSGILIGTAGVYHVASQLAARGFHAAPTFGNAPSIDILVGSSEGQVTLCIQVKTSFSALHLRGRGEKKYPYQYQWDVGEKSAKLNQPNLFFAFVDLRNNVDLHPDVFIMPSTRLSKYFEPHFKKGLKRWRLHQPIKEMQPYKNNWQILWDYLNKL